MNKEVNVAIVIFLAASKTADAICTGTPHPCADQAIKQWCESIEGCEWTGAYFFDGKCEGTPLSCDQFPDRRSCQRQGCTYRQDEPEPADPEPTEPVPTDPEPPTFQMCTGTPLSAPLCTGKPLVTDCYDGPTGEKGLCEGILGCEWTSTGPLTWDGYCVGSPTPCEDLDASTCSQQSGCKLFRDPPNPNEAFYDAIMPLDLDFECQLPVKRYGWDPATGYWVQIGMDIVCDKCRPSTDGYVCYTEMSIWRHGLLISHENVMKIGDRYCETEFCPDGSTAFNCEEQVTVDDPNDRVVGHSCNGDCIWKFP